MIRSIAVAVFAAALCAVPALAAPAPQLWVAVGDVNLASAAGRATALGRIQAAAEAVCGPVQYSFDTRGSEVIAARNTQARCVRRAVAGAVGQLQTAGYAMKDITVARPDRK